MQGCKERIECAYCDDTCRPDLLTAMGWRDFSPNLPGPLWSHLLVCPRCIHEHGLLWWMQGKADLRWLGVPTEKDLAGIEP